MAMTSRTTVRIFNRSFKNSASISFEAIRNKFFSWFKPWDMIRLLSKPQRVGFLVQSLRIPISSFSWFLNDSQRDIITMRVLNFFGSSAAHFFMCLLEKSNSFKKVFLLRCDSAASRNSRLGLLSYCSSISLHCFSSFSHSLSLHTVAQTSNREILLSPHSSFLCFLFFSTISSRQIFFTFFIVSGLEVF